MKPILVSLLVILLMTACTSPSNTPTTTPIPAAPLVPYHTQTPTLPPAEPLATPTPLPSPSPTPRTHVLVNSDTLFGLAWLYNVTLEDLLAANPGIQPNALSVGATVIIPPSRATETAAQPTPPVTLTEAPVCYPSADGGLWCFLLVHNDLTTPLESVSAAFFLPDAVTGQRLTQTALTPLNLIPAGAALPLMAFFPPKVSQAAPLSAEVLTAFTPADISARYLPVTLTDLQTQISLDGASALVSGAATVNGAPGSLWIAAVAYAGDTLVGVRRWEASSPSANQTFTFTVYSLGAPITRVDLFAEAKP